MEISLVTYIDRIINTTIDSFDFTLIISINIATYLIIKLLDDVNGEKELNVWIKRLVMLAVTAILGLVYFYFEWIDAKLILNSAILAQVFWSWIGKPIVSKFGIGYKG